MESQLCMVFYQICLTKCEVSLSTSDRVSETTCTGTTGSLVVCISPLTSIMMDQQQKLVLKGIKAEFVGDAQTDPAVIQRVLKEDLQLLYISPESLVNNVKFCGMLLTRQYKEKLVALAIDEAHCIKTW